MGNCFGTSVKTQKLEAWRKTGIISLRDSKLTSLPEDVAGLCQTTKVIDAGNNRIEALPEVLRKFQIVQRIVFSNNNISSIQYICAVTTLKQLFLDVNCVREVPEEIGALTNLERLSLSQNQISKLPSSIGCLKKLQFLSLNTNALTSLPEELSECSQLEQVEANMNQLTRIPSSYGQLTKLKTLSLDNNKIATVPSEVLVGCISLQTLSLHDNPITTAIIEAIPGFQDFEKRRRDKVSKAIATGVLLGSKGLDEVVKRI